MLKWTGWAAPPSELLAHYEDCRLVVEFGGSAKQQIETIGVSLVFTYVYTYMYIYIYVCMYVCMYIHIIYTYIYIYTYVNHTYRCVCVDIIYIYVSYIHVYIHMYYIYMCVYIYTYTSVHKICYKIAVFCNFVLGTHWKINLASQWRIINANAGQLQHSLFEYPLSRHGGGISTFNWQIGQANLCFPSSFL